MAEDVEKKPKEEEKQPGGEETPSENPIDRVEKLLGTIEEREKALAEREKLLAERMLSGTAGGALPKQEVTEEEQKKQAAIEYWKGTGIDEAIKQYDG